MSSNSTSTGATKAGATAAPPLVRFDRVSKSYDGQTAVVRDLSLDIARGEFLTLLGPSGSGKTTTLMMLAGFEAPDEGEIYLGGRAMSDTPPHRRNLGVVFQSYALFPHMSVESNVAYPLRMRGIARADIKRRLDAALDMVRLGSFRERRPAMLSGGQQQRVALARALVFEPDLVLMDEPLGALDKHLREHMQSEIKDLQRRLGLTLLYVTHDQTEALSMSDRVAVFNGGRIEQLGSPVSLYEEPMTPFVAQFIGENNQLFGRVVAAGPDQTCSVDLGGAIVPARLITSAAIGSDVCMSIRPERIVVEQGRPRQEAVAAEVIDITYLGDICRARVLVPGGTTMVLKLPVQQFGLTLERGSALSLSWQARYCRAMPKTPSSSVSH